MKPLIVLLLSFGISLLIIRAVKGSCDYALSGRIALAIMLCFTAIAHFAFTEGMSLMVPAAIPFKTHVVYASGVLEIALAAGLLLNPQLAQWSGWLLILFFIAMLPANIQAALQHINYETASFQGPGPSYLWFRVPLQLFFIAWAYFCTRL